MTPTESDLQRLAAIAPELFEWDTDEEVFVALHEGFEYHTIHYPSHPSLVDVRVFASIVRDLLSPWTPVPCGDQWVLIHIRAVQDIGLELFVEFYPDAEIVDDATRFSSPLAAAEALHQNTEGE